jgi:hypothetical protein
MTTTVRWAAAAALATSLAHVATPPLLAAQTGFEGVMTFVTRDGSGAKVDTLVQTVKGKNLRMEGLGGRKGGGGSMIIDADRKRMVMIDDKERSAMIVSMDDADKMKSMTEGMTKNRPAAARPTPARNPDDGGVKVTKTGRTETVAGVRCEVYHATSTRGERNNEGDVCVADGVGFAMLSGLASMPGVKASSPKDYGEMSKVMGPGKGIVKATTEKDGKSYVALELVKVDRKSVPASSFEPPAGYKANNMADMMSQMQGALQQLQQGKKAKPPVR